MDASNPVLINYGNDNFVATEAWYFLLQNTGKCFSLTAEYQKSNFFVWVQLSYPQQFSQYSIPASLGQFVMLLI